MDSEMIYCLAVIVASFLLILYKSSSNHQAKLSHQRLPPSPPALPIIGHLHLLKDPHHRSLQELSSQYGPILYLWIGKLRFLVISSPKAAEECFTKSNDIIFANRPKLFTGQILGYNWSSLVWAPYGDHWRNLRRVTTLELFSTQRIAKTAQIRYEEIRFMLRDILNSPKVGESGWVRVELNHVLFRLTRCVMMRIVCGKRWVKGPLDELFLSSTLMTLYDYFPILRWIIGFKGLEKKVRDLNRRRNGTLDLIIEEVKSRKLMSESDESRPTTVLEQLLVLQKAEPEYYTDDIIKSTMVLMFTAGTDTSARTMEWAMSLLLNHPTTLQKARNEIDTYTITHNRLITDSDLPNFPYIRCIINETLRLFPVAPLLVPHYSSSDVTISNYHIPKNTILLINVWALHRDPTVWDEPDKFKPERFMKKEMEGDGFKYLPFGAGRRVCPGANLSIRTMSLALATLIQCFDWERVEGNQPVDLSEETKGAVTMPKSEPLHAVCRVREGMDRVLAEI